MCAGGMCVCRQGRGRAMQRGAGKKGCKGRQARCCRQEADRERPPPAARCDRAEKSRRSIAQKEDQQAEGGRRPGL